MPDWWYCQDTPGAGSAIKKVVQNNLRVLNVVGFRASKEPEAGEFVAAAVLKFGKRTRLLSKKPEQEGEKKAHEDASDEREIKREVSS
jgi:hypothetical protein